MTPTLPPRAIIASLIWLCLAFLNSAMVSGQTATPGANPEESGIRWLLDPGRSPVQVAHQIQCTSGNSNLWEGIVTNTTDPFLVFPPVRIDADSEKILYLNMAVETGRRVQLFFSADDSFQEELSCHARGLAAGSELSLYALDLSEFPKWRGKITSLRLDLDGSRNGTRVKFARIGSGKSGITAGAVPLEVETAATPCTANRRRNAAFQDTIVATDECYGSSAVMTFVKTHFSYVELNVLARLLVRAEAEGRQFEAATAARGLKVEDLPGGVRAQYQLAGAQITSEILPLRIGRDTPGQDGAALFTIRTEPPVPVIVDCGDSMVENPFGGLFAHSEPTLLNSTDQITLESGTAFLASKAHPLKVAIRGDAALTVKTNLNGGQYLSFRAPSGQLSVLVSYAEDDARLRAIAATDFAQGRKQVEDYCAELLQARVQTPVKNIDAAFRTALYNLEYAWNAPYGWTESINFWHALWHMQHTAGEEWIGHADRSRLSNETHAENLMPNGAVPQMMQYAHKRRDFGGSNQFFAWQVRHYWHFTGDLEFARKLAPVLDRVIAQTFRENDPDGNYLLGWGQQIGNQEDFISTPHDGTSPAIEGINMFRTRRELALALGDHETAARCEARIHQIQAGLWEKLWLRDLGRFAFYRDPLGELRLDGQYHSMLYPVIWQIADPLDSYSMLRQVRDRLTGKDGEVFCSDNFVTHAVTTTGVQAGIAQQPWAAWALATAGRRNEVVRPLQAAANWVMDDNHRGAWPEISYEPSPAYFSPPIGLWVAATVEALFGLKVDKPAGRLQVAPCFPDHWPAASLNLPDYQAEFTRQGDTLEYVVRSREPLTRQVRWSLPPGRVSDVSVDGKPVEYHLEPGVECLFLTLETKPSRASRIRVKVQPFNLAVNAPASIAEGDPITVSVNGIAIEGVEDHCGLLAETTLASSQQLQGRISTGLLEAYRGYGRLGQMTFARRTFFLRCLGPDQTKYWLPVDLAILPRYEAAPAANLHLAGDTISAKLLIRNNTVLALNGTAWLQIARDEFPCAVSIAPRSQAEVSVSIPARQAAWLSPGDNAALLVLPGKATVNLVLNGSPLFREQEPLRQYQKARIKAIALPRENLIPDTQWNTLRSFKAYVHPPWSGLQPPLLALGNQTEVTAGGLEEVRFQLAPRQFVPISHASGRPSWSLSLSNLPCKKLYLLVIPFTDNHDVYSPVAQVAVETAEGAVLARTLRVPGDLDWWAPPAIVGEFASARQPRKDRFGLLPLLNPAQGDWEEGQPPAFPQSAYWATCRQLHLSSAVLNVVEMDLGRPRLLKSLTVSTLGSDPALGVVALAAETDQGLEALDGTPYAPPAKFAAGRVLFAFQQPDDTLGWQLEGDAFSVSADPQLFPSFPTLNSVARAGEKATGRATSPEFTIRPHEHWMLLEMHGGRSASPGGECNLCIRLVDAQSGAVLREVLPTGSHLIAEERVGLEGLQGKRVRLELVDRNSAPTYAWIGLRRVTLTGNEL